MFRRLFTIACALSLCMCVGTGALWVRSCYTWDELTIERIPVARYEEFTNCTFYAENNRGQLTVAFQRMGQPAGPRRWRFSFDEPYELQAIERVPLRHWLGCDGWHIRREGHLEVGITLPLWLLTAVLAVLPIARALARRSGSSRHLRCRRCGYDLRATPHRCPECGADVTAALSSAGGKIADNGR